MSKLSLCLVVASVVAAVRAQLPTDCGQSVFPPSLKIVGGQEAKPYSWPWQVSMRYNNAHICGASVIDNSYVLTAAHCTNKKSMSSFSLRAGRHSVSGSEPYEQIGTPSALFQHESYNPDTVNNDISIFKLQKPYTFNNYVRPVCLPTSEITTSGEQMYATGWGDAQGTCCAGKLKQVMLPSVDRKTCQKKYYGSSITDAMICAGQKTGDNICFGDSGGPLVNNRNGRWEQHGASSWVSSQQCNNGGPAVFTNIFYFDSWIKSKMELAETDEQLVEAHGIRPIPYGAAFRQMQKQLENVTYAQDSIHNSKVKIDSQRDIVPVEEQPEQSLLEQQIVGSM